MESTPLKFQVLLLRTFIQNPDFLLVQRRIPSAHLMSTQMSGSPPFFPLGHANHQVVAIKCPGCSTPKGMQAGRRKVAPHKSPDFCNWNIRLESGRLQRAEQEQTFTKRCEKNHNNPKHSHLHKSSPACRHR